jgi:hypothetical protein
MVAQGNPDVYEAFDVEYAEEQRVLAELAAEAAAEEDEWTAQVQATCARVDALLASFSALEADSAREREAIIARAVAAGYYPSAAAVEAAAVDYGAPFADAFPLTLVAPPAPPVDSCGDYLAARVAELASDEEPDWDAADLSDAQLLRLR